MLRTRSSVGVAGPLLLGVLLVAADAPAAAQEPAPDARADGEQEPAAPPQVPPEQPLGPVTLIVRSGGVAFVDPARGAERRVAKFPLAEAIRMAGPGDVIGVEGDLSGEQPVQVGGGPAGQKPFRADWGDEPVRHLAVVGLDADRAAAIGSLVLHGPDAAGNGGVASIRLENLTLRASPHARQPLLVPKGALVGTVAIYRCTFAGSRAGGYGGHGQKWGVRSAGRGTFDVRATHCEGVQEHVLYLDSPQGTNLFVDLTMEASTRTMIQIVNRSLDNPGPPSRGDLVFERCHARGIAGDGGSAFTLAGHLGRAFLRDCSVRASRHGALVVWTAGDARHGAYLERDPDGRLYATRYVEVDGFEVDLPEADRGHLMVSGCRELVLRNFDIRGNRAALVLDSPHGARPIDGPALVDGERVDLDGEVIRNGRVLLDVPPPASSYEGFKSSAQVVDGTRALSAAEVDALGRR